MIKKFAEIWEEEKAKYKDFYKKEEEENQGTINLGSRKKKKIIDYS